MLTNKTWLAKYAAIITVTAYSIISYQRTLASFEPPVIEDRALLLSSRFEPIWAVLFLLPLPLVILGAVSAAIRARAPRARVITALLTVAVGYFHWYLGDLGASIELGATFVIGAAVEHALHSRLTHPRQDLSEAAATAPPLIAA